MLVSGRVTNTQKLFSTFHLYPYPNKWTAINAGLHREAETNGAHGQKGEDALAGRLWYQRQCYDYLGSKKSPTGPTERTPEPGYLVALATSLGSVGKVPFNF